MDWAYFYITLAIITSPLVNGEDDVCRAAFVPCPRAKGFFFFNQTCYAVIHDQLPFSKVDARFKCESGMHLGFSSAQGGELPGQHRRIRLARVTGRGAMHTLTRLLKQVVTNPRQRTLVGLECSTDCSSPDSWSFDHGPGDQHEPADTCASHRFCNWRASPSHSAWTVPPGSNGTRTTGRLVVLPQGSNRTLEAAAPPAISGSRVAVLEAPGVSRRLAALGQAPATLPFHSVACELFYHTTEDSIDFMIAMGVASEADVALTSQLITKLTISSAVASKTKVSVRWAGPICPYSGFYITTQVDGFSEENRTEVAAVVACSPDGDCSAELELPPCALVYVQVGAIIGGEDAAPRVEAWQTLPPTDPDEPKKFAISDISGPAVTFSWERPGDIITCQPYHLVTVFGYGEVTVAPGQTKVSVHLGKYCTAFNASIQAIILSRRSGVHAPVHGVAGPKAPSSVEALETGTVWSLLRWSWADAVSSRCLLAKYRVECLQQVPEGPSLRVTADQRHLNFTGLQPGTRYSCGVCALAQLSESDQEDYVLQLSHCGEMRQVQLQTRETIPGPPFDLNISRVEHDSVNFRWRRPKHPNGIIQRYSVRVDCEQQLFPLCAEDPQCHHRNYTVELAGNDTDVVSFRIEGLQAARNYTISVAAATAVGQGNFSDPLQVTTVAGVPPAPRRVVVSPRVKAPVGSPEMTSVSVSLLPPCPYPGLHGYRLLFEKTDFLSSYRSSVRSSASAAPTSSSSTPDGGNITFSVFDGKWTPGFQYRVRIVALSQNSELGDSARTASDPVTFTMAVPPPGPVQALQADCSAPLNLSFSWTNPVKHAFGVVSYRSKYRCRQLATGQQVGGSNFCNYQECPCLSSLRASDQCRACQRVCNYPVKTFKFKGVRTYYFNCSCRYEVPQMNMLVVPGSECWVSVQAVSKYHRQLGAVTLASCRSEALSPQVTELTVTSEGDSMDASWDVPKPVAVPTKAYHVRVERLWENGTVEIISEEIVQPSQCEQGRCQFQRHGLDGEGSFRLQVAAESVYAVPPVGPRVERSFTTPPRVPEPPTGDLQRLLAPPELQDLLPDPTQQFRLNLPADIYDRASGKLREARVIVLKQPVSASQSDVVLPSSGGDVSQLPLNNWRLFAEGKSNLYQASAPGFIPTRGSDGSAEFVLGADLTCRADDGGSDLCNGPLSPNTSYAVRVVTVNAAGFAVSAPAFFRTRSPSEVKQRHPAAGEAGGQQAVWW